MMLRPIEPHAGQPDRAHGRYPALRARDAGERGDVARPFRPPRRHDHDRKHRDRSHQRERAEHVQEKQQVVEAHTESSVRQCPRRQTRAEAVSGRGRCSARNSATPSATQAPSKTKRPMLLDRIDIERDRDEDARRSAERQHPGAAECVAEGGRRVASEAP
jgi:hypothetical protein